MHLNHFHTLHFFTSQPKIMGNCHVTEVSTILIQHPNRRIEKFYWPITAREVMNLNPEHYIALVLPAVRSENGLPVKRLKLLRSDDNLVIGQVYRLISFEDVLKEYRAKKCVKLGKLLKERGVIKSENKPKSATGKCTLLTEEHDKFGAGRNRGKHHHPHHHHQWKPALQSIAELGT